MYVVTILILKKVTLSIKRKEAPTKSTEPFLKLVELDPRRMQGK